MPIRDDVKIGNGCRIFEPCNLYGCEIGDETTVGTFVEIREGVVIGRRCKIQAFAFIPEGVAVGDGVFIGPHVCFTNDRWPRAVDMQDSELPLLAEEKWTLVPTVVEACASIGAGAVILPGARIGSGAMVGAGAVVTKDVPPWTLVCGNPARIIRTIRETDSQ